MDAVDGIATSSLLILSSLLFCVGFTLAYGRRNLRNDLIFWLGSKHKKALEILTLYLASVAPILFLVSNHE